MTSTGESSAAADSKAFRIVPPKSALVRKNAITLELMRVPNRSSAGELG
jgi:hypothetical protein